MKWFKHDSSAHIDAKMKKLRHKYGITGYGLYWYCIELIAGKLDSKNISFTLEDDAETIAMEWNLDQIKVQEIMYFMCELGLFESDNGDIKCLKLGKRLEDNLSRNPEVTKILQEYKILNSSIKNSKKQLDTVTNGAEQFKTVCNGTDKIRLDETKLDSKKPMSVPDVDLVLNTFTENLPSHQKPMPSRWKGSTKEKYLQARWKEDPEHRKPEFWEWFFQTVKTNPHWMGQSDGGWKPDIEWMLKRNNFDKIIQRGADNDAR